MGTSGALFVALGLTLGVGLFLIVNRAGGRSISRAHTHLPWLIMLQSAGIGSLAFLLSLGLTGIFGLAIAVSGLGISILPWLHARRRRRARENAQAAFPELIEILIARLRSGDSLLGALGLSAEGAPAEIAQPLDHFATSYIQTGNPDVCLDELKASWASSTGDILVETVRVAHYTGGGNTLDVLRDLADQVRQYQTLTRDIQAKQSWLKVAARVGVAAPWVVLIFLSFRGEAVAAYNSPMGIALLTVGLGLTIGAYWLMIAIAGQSRSERVFAG